jgi:hypothetical protein
MPKETNEILSHRLPNILVAAIESDFYSKDGETWDANTDPNSFYQQEYAFKLKIGRDMQALDPESTSLDGASQELLALIDRVEARGDTNA